MKQQNDELEKMLDDYEKEPRNDLKIDIALKLTEMCGLGDPALRERFEKLIGI